MNNPQNPVPDHRANLNPHAEKALARVEKMMDYVVHLSFQAGHNENTWEVILKIGALSTEIQNELCKIKKADVGCGRLGV